jgi:hypothetical protein
LLGEEFTSGDEVAEAVHLLLALAVLVPAIALVLAAAHMGDGVDEVPINDAERVGGEAGRNRQAIGAIAVKEEGGAAVERRLLAVEQRHRHRLAVSCRRHDAARDVKRRIVAARNFLSLAKLPRARVHVVVKYLRRRRHRGIGKAQGWRVVFIAGRDTESISVFIEGNGVLFTIGEAAYDNAWQSILALEPHKKVLVGHDIQNEPAQPVRLDFAPMLPTRTVHRRLDDAVILGTLGIGQDDELAVMMVHGIVVLGLARRDQAGSP